MKKLFKVVMVLALIAGAAYAANDFQAVDNTVSAIDTSARTSMGTVGRWIFGMIPLVAMLLGGFAGFMYQKKKGEQEKDTSKAVIYMIIGGILAGSAGVFFDAMLGSALLGNSSKGIQVLTTFWSNVLGV